MSTEIADPLAPSTTQVRFHDDSQNLLATEDEGDVTFRYDIFNFDEAFSHHFSESTFGVNIPLVYFGFDFNVHAKAALYAEVIIGGGHLDIDYLVNVNDIRAPNGEAVLTDGRPTDTMTNGVIMPAFRDKTVVWDTDYTLGYAHMTGDGSGAGRSAGIYLDYDFGFSIKNFTVGIDLYLDEFGLSPRTLLDLRVTNEDLPKDERAIIGTPYELASGALSGYVNAPTLPDSFGPATASGNPDLPTLTMEGDAGDFAHLGFDIAYAIGQIYGVELSGGDEIVDGLSYKYTILSVSLNSNLHVGQVITFTPAGIEMDINTSIKSMENGFEDGNGGFSTGGFTGEHLNGQLGDQFVFSTPAMGSGVMHAAVDYTLHGTISVEAQIRATAGVHIGALGAELHNTILKDFDIGVGPIINLDIPEGGIPLGGVDVYSNSLQIAITGTRQEFDFYWDHPLQGTDGDDTFTLNPLSNAPELEDEEGADNDASTNANEPSGEFTRTVGRGGDDEITGNAYNNPIYGGADNDVLYGMGGNDLLLGETGADNIFGGDGEDAIFGGSGDDFLRGGAGNDTIFGGNLLGDTAGAGGGRDTLFGDDGDDVLATIGGGDPDVLFGGSGMDTAVIDRSSSFYGELLDMRHPNDIGLGGDHYILSDGTDLYSIELLLYRGGKFEDTIITLNRGNIVDGGAGDDFLHSTAENNNPSSFGDDFFSGGRGDDIIQFNWGVRGTFIGGEGEDRLVADAMGYGEGVAISFGVRLAQYDVVGGVLQPNLDGGVAAGLFEKVTFLGSAFDDAVAGTDGDDMLVGNGGDDILVSNLGMDGLFGGDGDDILTSSTYFAPAAYVVQPNGIVKRTTALEYDLLDGGDDNDRAVIDRTTAIDGHRLTMSDQGSGRLSDGTQLISIEVLDFRGGGGKDVIRGGLGGDSIHGGGGKDQLDGGGGADVVHGGEGDDYITARLSELAGDYLYGDEGTDDLQADLTLLTEGIVLDLSSPGGYVNAGGVFEFEGFERYHIVGTNFDDYLIGGDAEADPNAYNPTGGGSTDPEDLAPFADHLIGGFGADTINGGLGRDFIDGGHGDDRLIWSYGGRDGEHDLLNGGLGTDTLVIYGNAQNSWGVVLLDPDLESDIASSTVTGVERLEFYGGEYEALVQGAGGNDALTGGTKADTLRGGAGDDVITGGQGDDIIEGGAGADVLKDYDGPGGEFDINTGPPEPGASSISGGEGDDFIEGIVKNVVLNGDGGNDHLSTGGSYAQLYGGAGDDVLDKYTPLYNQPGPRTIMDGGDGNDLVRSDSISVNIGGAGIDRLVLKGSSSNETIDFTDSTAVRTLNAGGSFTGFEELVLDGGAGNETVYLNAIANQLRGGGGYNTAHIDISWLESSYTTYVQPNGDFLGSYGLQVAQFDNITLLTGSGNDYLMNRGLDGTPNGMRVNFHAGAGDDTVGGGSGDEFMYGEEGTDTAVLLGNRADYIMSRSNGEVILEDKVGGRDGRDHFTGFEVFQFADQTLDGGFGNSIFGTDEADQINPYSAPEGQPPVTDGDDDIHGGQGDDILDGGLGADFLDGGTGNDTYIVDNASDQASEALSAGFDIVNASVSYTLSANVERLVLTAIGDFNGTGNGTGNEIFGNSGNNVLDGGSGDDTLYGGEGDDTIIGGDGEEDTAGVTGNRDNYFLVNNGDGSYTLRDLVGTDGEDTLTGVEFIQFADQRLELGAEEVEPGEVFNGGAGADTRTGFGGDDEFYGNGGNDVLNGAGGDDLLDGGVGADTLTGGLGDDTYVVDRQTDVIVEAEYEGDDTIRTSVSYVLAAGVSVEHLIATGTAANLTGNDYDNELIGNDRGNVLDGGGGADRMVGGLGNDTFKVDNIGDVVVELDGGGTDQVIARAHFSLAGTAVENLTFLAVTPPPGGGGIGGGIGPGPGGGEGGGPPPPFSYTGTGNGLANKITGANGADTLWGEGGDDTIIGGEGGDFLHGGAGLDKINGGLGNDTLWGDDDADKLAGEDGDDSLYGGDGDDTLTGGAGADSLDGGAGADRLTGGEGSDILTGGDGNDTFYVEDETDQVIELDGQGSDTIRVSASAYTMGAYVETMIYTALSGDFSGMGNAQDNLMTGAAGNDSLDGSGGDDRLRGMDGDDLLTGGLGADQLTGGLGADTLTGGSGADRFIFSGASDSVTGAADIITDFNRAEKDKIFLTALDANTGTAADEAFTFIGASAFTGAAGQLRYQAGPGGVTVFADTDGDGDADLEFQVLGVSSLLASDFHL